ncbi:fibronectin type III domain-containing protein [Winogradskyella sp. A3E31]|uniref:fibronectin type III domain-containing protein n=1 Tax=Winogradskyella sp. A3E31 TaxID=3349637 RepID=UPI00398B14D5
MTKKLRVIGGCLVVLTAIIATSIFWMPQQSETNLTIEEQRKAHEALLANSPFKETLKWDKKKRKLNGLPPNRYFEQMWELTINPATGKLETEGLTQIREQLLQERMTQRNPGEAGNDWEERGPNNVGGRTRVIMFDPNDASNNTVYAGGVSGGLWINTNISSSSSQWARVEGVPGNLSVTSITVDPNNSNRWFVGTGEQYTGGDVVGNGVYVTTNGGTTWNSVNIPAAGAATFEYSATNLFLSGLFYVNDVLAWDNNGNTELFVGVGATIYGDAANPSNWLGLQTAGLYHSANGGSTWNRIESSNLVANNTGGNNYYVIPNDFEVSADNKLWMGSIGNAFGSGGGKVYSSTNGTTWTEAGASPLADSDRVEIEPSASNPNKFYALTEGVSAPVHIYETTNAFGSISSTSLPNDADTGIASNDFCRGQAFYDLVIEADPANDNILYVGGIDLFKSTNGGSSWSQLSHWYGGFGYQYVHADQHSIAFGNNSSSEMLFGNDGGVYYSANAGSTIGVRNNNYNVTQFVKAGIGPDGAGDTVGIFSAGAQDNGTQAFRDGNAGPGINSSEELSDGDGFYTFVDKDGQYMIATYVFNVIYRFSLPWNGQGRLQGGATTLSSDQSSGDFVNQMDYDSDANRLLSNASAGTTYRIKSINVATTSSGTLTSASLNAKPTAFRASPFETNTWYVGTANGGLLRLTGVTNSGATFTTINTPFVGSVSSVRYGETANDIFVTIHNYGVTSVWATSDGGSSWVSKEGSLPNIPVRDILQNPLNRNEAILATQLGVWSTSDFNAANPSWSQAYNGMSDVSVTAFDYWAVNGDNNNNKIIASTYGRGVFTGEFTATTVPDTEAPSVPQNLVASNITTNSLDLNWDASTDNVGVSEYEVFQDGNSIGTTPSTNLSVTGLSVSTTYSYTVLARDASGNDSAQSAATQATTLDPDTTAPSIPANLSASNVTASSVDLSWSASTDNVAVADYDVFQDGNLIATVSSTSHQVTGLSQNTTYSFTVSARDTSGNVSAQSNSVSVTTNVECSPTTSNFNSNTLNHSGSGSTSTTLNFTGGTHEDASFTVSELNARTGGNPRNRFIDQVVVSYVDDNGVSQNYGTFTGDTTNTVNVSITGIIQSVTVVLSDGLGGNFNTSVTLSSVDSCVTLNCTDSDGDGVCDEDDQCPGLDDSLIGTSCDDGDNCTINDVYGPDCNCAGTYADSDGDGVCDGDDICPGGDDTIDLNGNGVPDDCDCTSGSGSFSPSTLNHSGSGSNSVSFSFTSLSKDVSFSISGLDARVNGKPSNRYEEVATVTYVGANGQTQSFNSYSGANQSTANVTISNFISEVTVSLSNGVSGSTASLSVSLSSIDFCAQNPGATANNQSYSTSFNSGRNTSIKDFAVFPNPVNTELNIRLGLDVENETVDVTLNIYDLRGKVIQKQQWRSISNSMFEKQIDVSRLSHGIYMVELVASNGLREMHKLIKN